MKISENTPAPNLDDRLADFADRVLLGAVHQIDLGVEDDLRGFEELVLRLHQAFPERSPDDAVIRRMQFNMNAHIRRQQLEMNQPFWKAWLGDGWKSQQTRQQTRLAFAGVMILFLAILVIPFLDMGGQGAVGAAGLGITITGWLAIALFLAGMFLWLNRRK